MSNAIKSQYTYIKWRNRYEITVEKSFNAKDQRTSANINVKQMQPNTPSNIKNNDNIRAKTS